MSVNVQNNNGTTTISFSFIADTAKILETGNLAADYWYNNGYQNVFIDGEEQPIPFDELSNMQKLHILHLAIKAFILEKAEFWAVKELNAVSKTANSTTVQGMIDLGED